MKPPPLNSLVRIEDAFDGQRIIIPKPKRRLSDWGGVAFLLFWLGGWAFGEYFAAMALWKNGLSGAGWFLAAWLGGWTVGGAFAIAEVIKRIKGAPTEIIRLGQFELGHELKKKTAYPKENIGKLELEKGDGLHVLYFDHGADRVYVGEHLKEPEREWLHEVLKSWKGA